MMCASDSFLSTRLKNPTERGLKPVTTPLLPFTSMDSAPLVKSRFRSSITCAPTCTKSISLLYGLAERLADRNQPVVALFVLPPSAEDTECYIKVQLEAILQCKSKENARLWLSNRR